MSTPNTGYPSVGKTFPLFTVATTINLLPNTHDRIIALPTAGTVLNLPTIASCMSGYELRIRNNNGGGFAVTATVASGSSDTFTGGATTSVVAANQGLTIICDHIHDKWQIEFGPA